MNVSTRECARLEPLLSAYIDHEATPDEARQIERHLAECGECTARLRRLQRSSPLLDRQLQALLAHGEADAMKLNRTFRPPPGLMFAEPPSPPLLARLATVAVALAIAGLLAIVLLRTPLSTQSTQTGAQPQPLPAIAPPAAGPIVWISVDGVVDPPTATYVRRGVTEAEQQHAALLVVALSPSAGLDGPTREVVQTLSGSDVPTAAYSRESRANPTAEALAAATGGTIAAVPPQAELIQMDPLEAIWHRLLDPTTAYLLFLVGLYAVFVEVAHPGALVPGVTGALCLTAAGFAFLVLPTNWLGVLAVVIGIGLMGLELHTGHHGLLVLCGTLCLGLGSMVLFSTAGPGTFTPTASGVAVAPGVVVAMVLAGLALGAAIIRLARRIQHLPPLSGLEQLIGARGVARSGLDPDGVVHVRGQLWSAHSRSGALGRGESVRVLARHGLVLEVESADYRAAATQKGAQL
jgi:membrane-bound serine protease (ClpP class)